MDHKNRKRGRPLGARKIDRLDDIQILALRQAGLSADQIAAQLGRGRATIFNRLKALRQEPVLPLGSGPEVKP